MLIWKIILGIGISFIICQHEIYPNNLENHEWRRLHLEAFKYLILGTMLFCRFFDGLLICFIDEIVAQIMLEKLHGSIDSNIHIGGHFLQKLLLIKS
jgi:hypothetical protein